MSDKIKETALEEVQHVKELTRDAVRSQTYLYPVKGISYFVTHRSLWQPLLSKLVPTLTLGLGVTIFMFVFTYLPQAALLAIVSGPLAALSSMLLVLSESSAIFNLLNRSFLLQDALVDTFDGTLLSKNQTSIVASGRHVAPGSDPIAKLGKLIKKPFQKLSPQALITYLMYLPLNFIPVLGTLAFVVLQGKRAGPAAHERYFQLKGMGPSERERWVREREAAYTSFGVPATLLEMVPVAGIFFAFTNTVGAALWAADLEAKESTAPQLREQAKRAE